MGLFKLQVIGNLGGDAIVNNVNGKNVINFNVCYTEKWKDASGTERNKSVWVSCNWWSDRTTVAQYLKKGTLCFIEGQPDVRTYKDNRNDVVPQITLRVGSLQLLGSKNENNGGNGTQNSSNASSNSNNEPDLNDPNNEPPF